MDLSPSPTHRPLPSVLPGSPRVDGPHAARGAGGAPEPESLAQLRGDCAHMAPHWPRAARGGERERGQESGQESGRAEHPTGSAGPSPESLRGVRVEPRSARLLEGMSEYGH